jgi:V8-like Glu-specific endopeptidase
MIEAVENQSEKLNLTETLFNHEDMPLNRAIKPVRHDTHRKELNWNEYYDVAPGDAYPYGRTVVAKPSGWPYCCIGMVSCQFEDKSLRSGLGALILGNFVLTCSRLVHSQTTGQLAKQIWFISLVQHHKGRATRVIKVDTQKKSEK